jgi:putative (di)nucleoside polyphosphate hydrolase
MSRETQESVPTEYRSGVGVMLLNKRGHVLVARRIDLPDAGWQMPQGGIDDGESPRAAAVRELREEIGTDSADILAESKGWLQYDLPQELIGKAWNGRWRGQRQKWFVMRFTGDDKEIALDTQHPEFSEWKWVPVVALPELVASFKRQVYLDLLAEFSQQRLITARKLYEMLADPIVRLTMAADSVSEEQVFELLCEVSDKLRGGDGAPPPKRKRKDG